MLRTTRRLWGLPKLLQKSPLVSSRHGRQMMSITGSSLQEDSKCLSCHGYRCQATAAPLAATSDYSSQNLSVQAPRATSFSLNTTKRRMIVKWNDGEATEYPFVWMRDNCQCSTCFHTISKARLLLMRNLDVDIEPKHIEVNAEQDQVLVTWSDDHQSPFKLDWLWRRRFTQDALPERQKDFSSPLKLWTAKDMENGPPSFDFSMVLKDDYALYEWLTTMEEYGLALLTDAPLEVGHVEKVAERVSYIRETHYGTLYDVVTRENPPNLAWTAAPLGLHTDMPCDIYSAGAQLLHCIKQVYTEGGDNEFVDAYYVAEYMRENYPDFFKILTTVDVDFTDVGNDTYNFIKIARHPTIKLNNFGEIMRIDYSNQQRDSYLNLPLDLVDIFYQAMRKFNDLMYDPAHVISIKLKPGQVICFHNLRVLHGRRGYNPVNSGDRHLHGFFIDWDELHSRRRVLKQELNIKD